MAISPISLYGSGGSSAYPAQVNSVNKTETVKPADKALTTYDTTLATSVERNKIPNMDPKIESAVNRRIESEKQQKLQDSGEKPDFAAINLMKNSFPDPMAKTRVQRYNLNDFSKVTTPETEQTTKNAVKEAANKTIDKSFERKMQTPNETQKFEDRIKESTAAKISEKAANEDAGSKLTPAQQRGLEIYEKVQNYTNSTTVSNVAMYAA